MIANDKDYIAALKREIVDLKERVEKLEALAMLNINMSDLGPDLPDDDPDYKKPTTVRGILDAWMEKFDIRTQSDLDAHPVA